VGTEYRRFVASEVGGLAEFLTGEQWPYHVTARVDHNTVRRRVADGYYDSAAARTFWIVRDGGSVGLVRLFDLDAGTPLFDLRVRAKERGRGVGRQALVWLTAYLFSELPATNRIEGTTRQDNVAMRRLFTRCGYAKEAHYRQAWPDAGGRLYDTVGYAILRQDWQSGTVTPVRFADEPG
jgi:RimJ/RimL family protein N-acetyltransferase